MRVLVTGGTGVVGWTLLDRFGAHVDAWYTWHDAAVEHPTATGRQLDVRDGTAVAETVAAIDPDVVVHCAAMTDVDACETRPDAAAAVNVDGTSHVLDAARDTDARVVYVSTSFVFDGSAHPHRETDPRTPVNVYGETKAAAEALVEDAACPTAIVRTDQPYGWTTDWQTQTMVEWTLDQLAATDTLQVFEDWRNVPTYLPDLAAALVATVEQAATGVFHAVGPEYCSRYEWAREIATAFDYDPARVEPVAAATADLPATRPNVYLDNTHTETALDVDFRGLTAALAHMAATEDAEP